MLHAYSTGSTLYGSLILLLACLLLPIPAWGQPQSDLDFAHTIVPILLTHCAECHSEDRAEGGFSINTRELILDSAMAVPGDVESSHFLELVTSDDPDYQMPPQGKPRVPAAQIALLKTWVKEGLPWEPGFAFGGAAYEPPLKPRHVELPPAQGGRTHPIDRLIDAYYAEHQLQRPSLADDSAFVRRAYLDLIGLLPTPEETDRFLADSRSDRRQHLVQELLARKIDYADHWLSFWNDLLRNDYDGTGFITGGRKQITTWLYDSLVQNKPFDQFTRELIAPPNEASRGFIDGIKWRGEVSAGQSVEIQFSQNVSQAFLGINMKCASCHNSFVDRWKLTDAYGLAAIYAEEPLELFRCDQPTGQTAQAAWLFPELGQVDAAAEPAKKLEQLAQLMTHAENGRLTRTIVNRLWQRLMGRGIVHPLDAMNNPPWNADLLDYLAVYLQEHDYDLKSVLELVATSETYASAAILQREEDLHEGYTFRGPHAKRMTAEQFVDAIWQLTGTAPTVADARVDRSDGATATAERAELQAKWIWGASAKEHKSPPAGEAIWLQTEFTVPDNLRSANAAFTCDNAFKLWVNDQQVSEGNNWKSVTGQSLSQYLRPGKNRITALATNAGDSPNPAGFYFQLNLVSEDGGVSVVASDATWTWAPRAGKQENPPAEIAESVVEVRPLDVWTNAVTTEAATLLVLGPSKGAPSIRASLVKSDFLMRALGRPNRDQIVSARPNELTTLEAITLANGPQLSAALKQGSQRLSEQKWTTSVLVEHLYKRTLCRPPTTQEVAILTEGLGETPTTQDIEDLLWSICMLPEFFFVH